MKKLTAAIFSALALGTLVSCATAKSICKKDDSMSKEYDGAWVLTYFKGQGNSAEENALYLAWSKDGLNWKELNGGKPALVLSGIGGNRIRDPFVFKKNDGSFVMIATDWTIWQTSEAVSEGYWNNPSPYLILADSDDLINYRNFRRIDFAQLSPECLEVRNKRGWGQMHAWAPEVFYDSKREEYGVIWSGDGDLRGKSNICRTYVNYTKDFVSFSKPELFFELKDDSTGLNITEIDATLIEHDSKWYMFFKGEANDAKDIQMAVSSTLDPMSFVMPEKDKYVTRGKKQKEQMFTEGPFIIKAPDADEWYLYADFYCRDGFFGCWKTNDLNTPAEKWQLLSPDEYSMPAGVRHANTVRISDEQLKVLLSHAE